MEEWENTIITASWLRHHLVSGAQSKKVMPPLEQKGTLWEFVHVRSAYALKEGREKYRIVNRDRLGHNPRLSPK
jgi:hypothetical protein